MRTSTRAVREATPGCKRALDVIWLALTLFFVIAFPIDVSRSVADFPAFYCAGAAVNAHENPYLEVPLGPCEWSKSHDTIYLHRFIVPAPLPPYALALYAVAANFDYHVVYRLHIAFSLLALGAAAYCLSSLCRFPAVAIFALEILSVYEAILNGQPVAFLLCAVVLCGWALHARRPRIAGALAAAMAFEPHLGLPLCAAVFLFSRRSRIVLATCATVLLIVSLATLPLSESILYLRDVLPAQAMSEAHFTRQYSLTLLLTTLGIATHPAIFFATLQYVVTAALGIVAAGRARPSVGNASIAFVPVAFALLGGTYIHFTQFLLALPAALLFTKYFKLQLTVSCVLLALTFDESGWNRSIDTSLVTAFAVFTWLAIANRHMWFAACAAIVSGILSLPEVLAPDVSVAAAGRGMAANGVVHGEALAQASWSELLGRVPAHTWHAFIPKIGPWLALGTICWLALETRPNIAGIGRRLIKRPDRPAGPVQSF